MTQSINNMTIKALNSETMTSKITPSACLDINNYKLSIDN